MVTEKVGDRVDGDCLLLWLVLNVIRWPVAMATIMAMEYMLMMIIVVSVNF